MHILQNSINDTDSNDYFGWSVSLSSDGNTAIVGVPRSTSSNMTNAGIAYIFTWSGSNWTQQAELMASDKASGDYFGVSVSLSADGNIAIVGAYTADSSGLTGAGAAYVFTRSGSAWTQQAKLVASDAAAGDNFGFLVSLSADGNTAVIGTYADSSGLTGAGATYIFTRSGTTWTQQAKLVVSDGVAGDLFGVSASLSGDGNMAIVGAYMSKNAAYVYTRSGSIWTQQAKLTTADTVYGGLFGRSVSLSTDGNTAVVGAPYANPSGIVAAGVAYVFTRAGSTWIQQAKLTASDMAAGDKFGWSSSLSSDGNTCVIGAFAADPSGISNAGAAYVFTRSGTTWTQQAKLTESNPVAGNRFGQSVSLDRNGCMALVGSRKAGTVLIFNRSGDDWK